MLFEVFQDLFKTICKPNWFSTKSLPDFLNPASPLGDRRSNDVFLSSSKETPLPFGEGYPPPPLPRLFWVGAAMCQGVLFRPRWLQEGLRCSKMASKMPQDSARSLKMTSIMPPRNPKRATRRFQVLSETPQDPSKSPKSFEHLKEINELCLLAVSLPMAPRWPKKAPRGSQEAPKTAPRAPKSAPRGPRDGPKRRF